MESAMKKAVSFLMIALCAALCAMPARALASAPLEPPIAGTPPVIDGVLDDAAWQGAPAFTDFRTSMPDIGRPMPDSTFAYAAFDRDNLYFAFRCRESEPGKIKTSVTNRDNMLGDDWICINLDSFNDQQACYAFYVNPQGIQGDSRFAANNEDFSVDLVWYSAGRVSADGYAVEVRIPLKSIRFSNRNPVEMGVIFERFVSRRSEHGTHPALDPAKGLSYLTQMRPLAFRDIKQKALLEVLPAVTFTEQHSIDAGELARDERLAEFSLTTKYGVASDLVVEGTYNPDFSQIEADAGQVDVNLRYDLFYPEKRPFFLEGRESFTVAATAASELDPVRAIVHTRTIVDPLAGVKLVGMAGARSRVAALYALDELPEEEAPAGGAYAQFPILRFQRVLRNESYLGGIYAGRELDGSFSRVGGVDAKLQVTEPAWFEGHALLSRAKADAVSAEAGGHSIGLRYRHGARNGDYDFSVVDVSDDFVADMGYVTRVGVFQATALARPKFYSDSSFVRRVDAELFSGQTRDEFSGLWETFNHASSLFYLGGTSQLKVKYSYSTEIFEGEKFNTGGFHVLVGGQPANQFYYSVLYRRIQAIFYSADPYQGKSNRFTAGITYQPSDKLLSELSFVYYDFYRSSDSRKIYDYPIGRVKVTFQPNKYLLLRGICEYNDYYEEMITDFLASFTYIPGTVIHLGYGSMYDKIEWREGSYTESDRFLETKRGLFFKMSYLWRL
jgi:hypothetical protein